MILYDLIIGQGISIKGRIWCTDGSIVSPRCFSSSREPYGYIIDENKAVRLMRSINTYSWYDSGEQCSKVINAGEHGYLPSIDELAEVYDSIMHGAMKEDLKEAGLYELCNYRSKDSSINGWRYIWSSTEKHLHGANFMYYNGEIPYNSRSTYGYILPFFKNIIV